MNTLTLTIVVSGDQFTMTSITRRTGESNWSMVSRALQNANAFVITNELGDFESITRVWS